MLQKIIGQLGLPKLVSSLIGVGSVRYSFSPRESQEMIFKSSIFMHACKTPLTAIRYCAEELSSSQQCLAHQELIESLKSSSNKLQELFSELGCNSLSGSRKFNLKQAVIEVSAMLRARFPSAIIDSTVDSEIEIIGNKLYLEEALVCVATNALEAYRPEVKPHLYLMVRKRMKSVQINIVDLGFGMSKLAKRIALMKGVSYKQDGSGVGLGFARYTIEKLFHGKMHILSNSGIGTLVAWQIPLPENGS